jgi:hypothetical protein
LEVVVDDHGAGAYAGTAALTRAPGFERGCGGQGERICSPAEAHKYQPLGRQHGAHGPTHVGDGRS